MSLNLIRRSVKGEPLTAADHDGNLDKIEAAVEASVQPGDPALTDAREWVADTISQAEAEAGTATTRRAFTAQRVFQAIAAWWNASAAKTKLDGIQAGAEANVNADWNATSGDAQILNKPTLGTAAALNVGTTANSVVQLDGSGRLPAVDGSQLTNLPAAAGTNLSYTASSRLLESSTGADVTLPLVSSTEAGLAPASGGGTANFLRADGTWAAPPGGSGSPGGSSGQLQWNNSGAFAGLSTSSIDGSGNMTFSGRWIQSVNGAADAPSLALTGTWFTGGTATTTKPFFLIEPAGTTSTNWSTAGTGLGVNAPNGFSGNLLDAQVDGSSKMSVSSAGILSLNLKAVAFTTANDVRFYGGGTISRFVLRDNITSAYLASNYALGWSNNENAPVGSVDLAILRDAADTLAQRRTTNAQTFRIYNTFTSATNFERGKLEWSGNTLRIGTEKGTGGGTARNLDLQTDGVTRLSISATTGDITVTDGENIILGSTTGTKIGTATTQKLGFFNATPVVQPAAVANATDAATVITQLNALLARVRDLGLIAT